MSEAATKYKTALRRASSSRHEERFLRDLRALGLPEPKREYRWAAELVGTKEEAGPGLRERLRQAGLKDWRFDFCWPRYKLAVEIEGLHSTDRGFGGGRHLSPEGFLADAEKYTEAQLRGWVIYRIPGEWVKSRKLVAVNILIRALKFHSRGEVSA